MAKLSLSPDVVKRIAELASDLNGEVEALRDLYDQRPERWRDGDAGMAADSWLETLDELVDTLENVESAPDA